MNKKLVCIYFSLMIVILLCGCQLAREDSFDTETDRLVGVFITKEYLDLFDIEGYLNDHISSFNGAPIKIENDERYNGRIYAVLKPVSITNEKTGEKSEIWEYVFETLSGIPFFTAKVTDPDGNSYMGTGGNSAICDSRVSIGDTTILEGTIYIEPGKLRTVYVNPVYQSGEGHVYLLAGQGMSFFGDQSEGAVFTQTLEEKQTITENGSKTEKIFKTIMHIKLKYPQTSVSIIQMNLDNSPINQQNYLIDSLPDSVEVSPEAAYIIVETRSVLQSGVNVKRDMFEPGHDFFTGYRDRGDGIFEALPVEFLWK